MSMSSNENGMYISKCDFCGLELEGVSNFVDAVVLKRESNWKTFKNEYSNRFFDDYCPECYEEKENKQSEGRWF